jgi:hypothetical protein
LLLQADTGNGLIRHIVISSGLVTTLLGDESSSAYADGAGSAASFGTVFGIALNAAGTYALVVSLLNLPVAMKRWSAGLCLVLQSMRSIANNASMRTLVPMRPL